MIEMWEEEGKRVYEGHKEAMTDAADGAMAKSRGTQKYAGRYPFFVLCAPPYLKNSTKECSCYFSTVPSACTFTYTSCPPFSSSIR